MDVIARMLPGENGGGKRQFMSGRKVAAADSGIYPLSCPKPGKPVLAPLPGAECSGHD
jgi:hypothetical protein